MRRFATFLLSGAALVAVSSAALAADPIIVEPDTDFVAPPAVSAPSNVCDAVGVGYFQIPGVDTCLKIGGAVEARLGYGHLDFFGRKDSDTWANVRARLDLLTASDTDIGTIGSHVRLSLNHDLGAASYLSSVFGAARDRSVGVELAYITVGPAYLGYKQSLFNNSYGYGEIPNLASTLGVANSLTAGFVTDIADGYYAGLAIEDSNRGQWISSYSSRNSDIDFVGRAGIKDQSWGGADVSAYYAGQNGAWAIKGTGDLKVGDLTNVRLAASYADFDGEDVITIGGGVEHAFTDQIKGFAGAAYTFKGLKTGAGLPNSFLAFVSPVPVEKAWLANAGVTWTPYAGFDVTGEVAYAEGGDLDARGWTTGLRFIRSW